MNIFIMSYLNTVPYSTSILSYTILHYNFHLIHLPRISSNTTNDGLLNVDILLNTQRKAKEATVCSNPEPDARLDFTPSCIRLKLTSCLSSIRTFN